VGVINLVVAGRAVRVGSDARSDWYTRVGYRRTVFRLGRRAGL